MRQVKQRLRYLLYGYRAHLVKHYGKHDGYRETAHQTQEIEPQGIEQRVGAKLLPEIYENVTDPKQYELLEMSRISGFVDRARGTGRPTKKERRALDEFTAPIFFDDFDEEDDDD